jgi:hypothetical protein
VRDGVSCGGALGFVFLALIFERLQSRS